MDDKNVVWHDGVVDYARRCSLLKQQGLVLWFTGLSGSGKSTLAVALEAEMTRLGKLVYRLDGDNIRHGLCSDLGFSESDRLENIRRITEVANLFKDAGVITLVSFITPLASMRQAAREKIGREAFREIYVKASVQTCMERDTKGFYRKAMAGEIPEFTGVSAPYEVPENPDMVIDAENKTVDACVKEILEQLCLG
jgi:adenylyl-sulfate kinase